MYQYLVCITSFFALSTHASNAAYITLSNQIARTNQLNVVANNVANVSTIGYEMNDIIFAPVDTQASGRKSNSFVFTEAEYQPENLGPLKTTGRSLDVAVIGDGYFKILTDHGDRYTLDGAMMPNQDRVLVNAYGMPYASADNQLMILPAEFTSISVTEDGGIYVDNEEIAKIGVFILPDKFSLLKEGKNLLLSRAGDTVATNPVVASGALRGSNVNSARAMTELIDLQRSVGATNSLMSEIVSLERNAITKMTSSK